MADGLFFSSLLFCFEVVCMRHHCYDMAFNWNCCWCQWLLARGMVLHWLTLIYAAALSGHADLPAIIVSPYYFSAETDHLHIYNQVKITTVKIYLVIMGLFCLCFGKKTQLCHIEVRLLASHILIISQLFFCHQPPLPVTNLVLLRVFPWHWHYLFWQPFFSRCMFHFKSGREGQTMETKNTHMCWKILTNTTEKWIWGRQVWASQHKKLVGW